MINEKYLYFAKAVSTADGSMNFDNEANQVLALTTGGFANPMPAGVNFITNGGLKVTVVANDPGTGSDNQQFGSAYGTVATGDVVDITAACTIHASNGEITMATVASDAVNGFTINTDTVADNDTLLVTQLKPYEPGDAIMIPASKIRGIQVKDADETYIYTEAMTGDGLGAGGARDTITITHGSGKFKELSQMISDIIADPRQAGEMIVVADLMNDTFYDNNRAGITAVAYTLDT